VLRMVLGVLVVLRGVQVCVLSRETIIDRLDIIQAPS